MSDLPSNVIPLSEARQRLREEVYPPLTWKEQHQKAMDELDRPTAGMNGEWDDQC